MKSSNISLLVALALAACAPKGGETVTPKVEPKNDVKPVEIADPRYEKLPEPTANKTFHPPAVRSFETKNGITVYYVEAKHIPLVSLHLVVPQGSATDPKEKAGLTSLTVDLLDDGAGKLDEFALSDELGRLATDFHTQVSVDHVVLSMNALAENAGASLDLLVDILSAPKLGKAEFERTKERRLSEAAQRKKTPQSAMGVLLAESLFGSGYAGTPLEGTETTIPKITLADVKAQANELRKGEGLKLVISGQLSLEDAKTLAEKSLGRLGGKRSLKERPLEATTSEKVAYLAAFPGAAQSTIAVAKRAGPFLDPNYFPELVFNRQIGEAFTSRINMNLREDKGFTYGATSLFRRYEKAGFFAVITSVQSRVTEPALAEILRELSDVCKTRPLTPAEQTSAIQGLLEGFPGRFEMLEETATQITSIPLQNRPLDYFETWPSKIASVKLEDAQKAALPYCKLEDYRIVVAGDPSVVKPSLEKLGYKVIEGGVDGATKVEGTAKAEK